MKQRSFPNYQLNQLSALLLLFITYYWIDLSFILLLLFREQYILFEQAHRETRRHGSSSITTKNYGI